MSTQAERWVDRIGIGLLLSIMALGTVAKFGELKTTIKETCTQSKPTKESE